MNISVFTNPAIGGTFLSWTIYYLSGSNEYYHYKRFNQCLTHFPLTKVNAHGFKPNWISKLSDLDLLKKQIKMFESSKELNIFYMHTLNSINDSNQCIEYLSKITQKKIIVSIPNTHHFYYETYKKRAYSTKYDDPTKKYSTNADEHEGFIDYFFHDSKKYWEDQNLTEMWDCREFLALNLRPYERNSIADLNIPTGNDVMYLDARDLWCTLDLSIKNVFEWLELSFDESRFTHWLEWYRQWRAFHYNQINFSWYFDEIIDSIINSKYIDLRRFDLDIVQEAVIQHELIYKHGLNLKTYKLNKFENTLQLHNLLEENFHLIDNVYNVGKTDD